MDTFVTVCSIIMLLLVMEVDIAHGFTAKRINSTVKHGQVNVTCITRLIVANESSGSKQEVVPRPENVSTLINDSLFHNKQNNSNQNSTITSKDKSKNNFTPRKKELPMAMIIAGPAAAVGIALFLCILYYWHTRQLDSKARELSMTLYVTPDESTDSNDSATVPLNTNGSRSPRLSLPPPTIPAYAQRRKSTLSVPNLGIPGNMHKRGSSWSAIADQEIISHSAPRRHSTFIL